MLLLGICTGIILFCTSCSIFTTDSDSHADQPVKITLEKIDAWNHYLKCIPQQDGVRLKIPVDFSKCPFLSASDIQQIHADPQIELMLFVLQDLYTNNFPEQEKGKVIDIVFLDVNRINIDISREKKTVIVKLLQKIFPDAKFSLEASPYDNNIPKLYIADYTTNDEMNMSISAIHIEGRIEYYNQFINYSQEYKYNFREKDHQYILFLKWAEELFWE